MLGRSSRAERRHAHDILACLKEKVVEHEVNDKEGPPKLKRLLEKCLHRLDALPSEHALLAKAKEAAAFKWIVRTVKSHVKFRKKGSPSMQFNKRRRPVWSMPGVPQPGSDTAVAGIK